jgi:hypothetical protein
VKITGELRERMIAYLSDPESRQIISSVLKEPKTATTVRIELNLPASSAYRKISELRDCGLLMVDRFLIRPDGKREALYSCSFSEIDLKVESGDLVLEVVPSKRSLEKRWFELFFSRTTSSADRDPSAFETS